MTADRGQDPGVGHVLNFGPVPTGRYGADGWIVAGVSGDTWLSAFVSLHEAAHAGLNGATAWGQLLGAMWRRPGPRRAVSVLVEACVATHEAYATHSAVMGVLGRADAPSVAGIRARYPSYGTHLDHALKAGPHARPDNLVRAVAADSVLAGCMQADVLDVSLEGFTASRVNARNYPDSLLKAVLGLGATFWDGWDRMAADEFGRGRWAELSEVGLRDEVGAGERRRLSALCSAYVAERFRAMGRPVLDTAAVLGALPRIAEQVTDSPVTIDRDPANLFDLESLRLRAPRPATVTEFGGSMTGDPMVVVRRASVWRRQHALGADPLPPGEEPVVALRRRSGAGVLIERVGSPGALPAAGLASIALTCARDAAWAERWKDAFDRVADVFLLIDTPFGESLDALLSGTTGFRYAIEPLLDGTGLWAYVCSVDGFPPLTLPCSMTRAAALRIQTGKRTGGREPDDLGLVVRSPAAARSVLSRIVAEESVVGEGHGAAGR
ncbi:hypothetical protein ACGFJ7_12600 [Actinoplanes sp. NPDC048988]|uniref:hypothetical protein n=1 Tax=Actinoplanes sp. NPDC048988 TaxID=3363901 RepID=UPI00371E1373